MMDEKDYMELKVKITDTLGGVHRFENTQVYTCGKSEIFILCEEFKRALVAAGYGVNAVNKIQYLEDDEIEIAAAAGVVFSNEL